MIFLSISIPLPFYAIPETFLSLPLNLILSPLFFSPLPLLRPKLWLPFKMRILIPFPLSLLLSILPPEVGGLSEKTGPVVLKANRQPHDRGVKGAISTQAFQL